MDGEFTHPKNVIRKEIQRLGAIGPQEDNSITGFAGANQIVHFLQNHALFSPQFEKEDRLPDRKGYTMKRRYAKKADLTQQFGLLTLILTIFFYQYFSKNIIIQGFKKLASHQFSS